MAVVKTEKRDVKNGKIIRIDLDVLAVLKREAYGFETPNTTLRRVLGLPPK